MKIPLSWLREYVNLPASVQELAERLTFAGLEVGSLRFYGLPVPSGVRVAPDEIGPVWAPDKVVSAKILKVDKHPNADKLKLVSVEYGAAEPKVVVTGAPNIAVGDSGSVVILGLSGTQYRDGHATPKTIKELKPSMLRGVPSDAMVMSEYELGISEEHEGIIVLPSDTPVGVPAADLMGDVVLEADILPNMARCLAMLGVAREVAALIGQDVRLPSTAYRATGTSIDGKVTVSIADPKLSSRYSAILLESIKVGASPAWMQRRLAYAGMRPITNVVDITNYVMLEWGQPLHAFDYDALLKRSNGVAPAIVVRLARPGEVLVTLDKVERKLSPDTLVIADAVGPVALAGVMGGLETEVSNATTRVLLESANFDPVSIRRTMRALDLPSEASLRFSKGIHPATVVPAIERAAKLLIDHANATACAGIVDTYPAKPALQVVELKSSEIKRILGIEVSVQEVKRVLTALDFQVETTNDGVRATVPTNRLDIQSGAADLIEEIARVHGYDRLPATLLADPLPAQLGNPDLEREEHARDVLAGIGFQEVMTYSLTTPERESPLSPPAREYVRLVNPISTERVAMRQTLLAGVLDVAAANLRHNVSVRLFEIGHVYLPKANAKLPDEPRRLAIVACGTRSCSTWQEAAAGAGLDLDFFDLKGAVESLVHELHVARVSYQRTQASALHPGRSAELKIGEMSIGTFGELHPKVASAFDLNGRAVLVAEFDLDAILAAIPERYAFDPVPRFPAALRDIAVVVDDGLTAEKVSAEIRAAGGELLRGVRLFDLYKGPSIPTGTKSLAFALSYQADDRTLADKEIDKAHKKVEDRLKHVLKAAIRGKD
ncbi:MAG: phenylalanine--tRNA ligase subunit beta [Gemmataceae bacterium]